MGKVYME